MSWGTKTSNMLIMSYIGDQVWLITSRQTDPELKQKSERLVLYENKLCGRVFVQFINIRMKDPVDKTDTWALVRVLIR